MYKMKVIEIVSSFSPGGAEILVKDLAINLCKKVNIEVWALGRGKDKYFEKKYVEDLKRENVKTLIFCKKPHRNRVKIIIDLRKQILKYKPDIINTHLEHVNFFVVLATFGLNIPIVHTIHNTKIKYLWFIRFFLKYFIKMFVAISIKTKEVIQRQLNIPSNKISLILNGINLQKFNNLKRIEKEEVKNIIAIGRLSPQKDYPNLLMAYKKLASLLKDKCIYIPQLNIVGDGKLKGNLLKMSNKLNIEDKVNFLGIRNDIPQLLKNNDLYIMASRWEGFSISLIEAIASGIPVIATKVGSNDEIIDDKKSGLLVAPNKPEILAEAMYKVILNKELRVQF